MFIMDKMYFEVIKCVGNAFSRGLVTQMLKFFPSLPIMGVPLVYAGSNGVLYWLYNKFLKEKLEFTSEFLVFLLFGEV